MPANSTFWSLIHQLAETVNANGDRTENLKGAVYDFRGMKSAEKVHVLLELNIGLLALQELSLLVAPHVGAAPA